MFPKDFQESPAPVVIPELAENAGIVAGVDDYHGHHPESDESTDTHTTMPSTGQHGGVIKVNIVLPTFGDPLYPEYGCNQADVDSGLIALTSVVGSNAQFWTQFYSLTNWGTHDNKDSTYLINHLHEHILAGYEWVWDERNEATLGYVKTATNNGGAWENDRLSFVAEHRFGCVCDIWEDGLVLHEISHNLMAQHYPAGGNPWVCTSPGSAMNYCDLGRHIKVHDPANTSRVRSSYWA